MTELSQEYAVPSFLVVGSLQSSSARYWLGDRESALTEFRQAVAAEYRKGIASCAVLLGLLAEMEAESQGPDAAFTRIDEALALARETGQHWSDAVLHRIRGDILLKHDPANTAPAEEAFLTAIASRSSRRPSFELRAALALAKLYEHTVARPTPAQCSRLRLMGSRRRPNCRKLRKPKHYLRHWPPECSATLSYPSADSLPDTTSDGLGRGAWFLGDTPSLPRTRDDLIFDHRVRLD